MTIPRLCFLYWSLSVLLVSTSCTESVRTAGMPRGNQGNTAQDSGPATMDIGGATTDAGTNTSDAQANDSDAAMGIADSGSGGADKDLPTGETMFYIEERIDGQDVQRPVIIHAPLALAPTVKYSIVIALHGNGGMSQQWVNRLREFVNDGRFIGVYPQGYDRAWNLGGGESNADDVGFIEKIVAHLGQYKQLDHTRRFVYGTSNGARSGVSCKPGEA